MRKTNGNKAKLSIIALTLVACLMIAGVSAYFTDADTTTNTFTVGKVSLDLQEPDWNPPTNILPEQEIHKDPQIKNDGINEEYVFMEVIVPYANVVTAKDDGTRNAAADTELFSYDVNSGWVEIGTAKKDEAAKTVTHLYAYGTKTAMTSLAKDATTPALFEYVRFANIVEDQNIETTTLNVVVNAYGIQTTNIHDADDTIDGNNADGKTAPEAVWSVITNQGPSKDAGNEQANTDIKQ